VTPEEKRLKNLARVKAYYQENKDAKKAYDAEYRKKNRAKINARFNEWRKANLEDQKAKEAARRALNPELYAETARNWRKKNAAYLKAYEAARSKNPERVAMTRKVSQAYKEAHPEQRRNDVRNRRAKLKAGGKLSKDIEQKLMKLQKGRCPVCKVDITEKFHLDHVVAIAAGGRNEDNNAQLLCPKCNQTKSAKDPIEFMQSNGFLL